MGALSIRMNSNVCTTKIIYTYVLYIENIETVERKLYRLCILRARIRVFTRENEDLREGRDVDFFFEKQFY